MASDQGEKYPEELTNSNSLPVHPTWHRFCMSALPRNLLPSYGDIIGAYHYIKHITSLEFGKPAPFNFVIDQLTTQIIETWTYCRGDPMCRESIRRKVEYLQESWQYYWQTIFDNC